MSLSGLFSEVSRKCFKKLPNIGSLGSIIARHSRIWEPDYLILGETKTPEYDVVNVQIKGYDFAVLENYQKKIIKLARNLKINVLKTFPMPQKDLEIHHYKIRSTDIEYKYELKLCERNILVVDVKSHIMPLFMEALITTCPPGVNISFLDHEKSVEEDRYLPNPELIELQEKLESVGVDPKKRKKRLTEEVFQYKRPA